ncbi:MAG: methylcrotonoyl-CoA carboxylase [Chlorobi bacterium]|nr:methylcrotonoyl-CoA carboxylase [Chlorobiota bacterium]
MILFNKILIANRGEIAVRIIKSAQKLGIKTVAVYSKADENALHVKMADQGYNLDGDGPQGELSDNYLNISKIIEAARHFSVDAVHPGYGFLAESPLLVSACEENNITFIGPNKRSIELMGNKIEARAFVRNLDIPMTEGLTGNTKELIKKSPSLKYPILVKAAAGGGGKGMRIVWKEDNLEEIIESTAREAKNYFGDGSVYIEKYVEEPRHIEFQILGDNYGNVVHLFERECSIQRRYQKIIEESPSPTLTPELREKMGEDAVKIASEVGYNSAGTIEFLVDKELNYYFLEMNTRIQVEHPVTEMVTGVDLVEEQIKVACGNRLSIKQGELSQTGHAIECRIYAEDPANKFMPSPGEIRFYKPPSGKNIRIDSGIEKAGIIHSFFDPMISKLIVHSENRATAIPDMKSALDNYIIHGIKTNISYLQQMISHKAFAENRISTKFCDNHNDELLSDIKEGKVFDKGIDHLLAFAVFSLNKPIEKKNIWQKIGYWNNNNSLLFDVDGTIKTVRLIERKTQGYKFLLENVGYDVRLVSLEKNHIKVMVNNEMAEAFISDDARGISTVSVSGISFFMERADVLNTKKKYTASNGDNGGGNLCSPMPGKVIKVNVGVGDEVKRGKVLLVVEAMKMENNITATVDAVVEKINVKEGDMVEGNTQLVYLETVKE